MSAPVRRSNRAIKPTAEGKQYRVTMSEKKLNALVSVKARLFAQATMLIVSKGDSKGTIAELNLLKSSVQEAYAEFEQDSEEQQT